MLTRAEIAARSSAIRDRSRTVRADWGRFERFMLGVAPGWMARREAMRVAADLHRIRARRYEAATSGRRTEGWRASSGSATTSTRGALSILRGRARDLVENNRYASRGVRVIGNDLIGTGIRAAPLIEDEAAADDLMELWESWAEDPEEVDADGLHDLYGLQLLAMRACAESGEVLIRRRFRRIEDGRVIPMQLQIIEADHLDNSKDTLGVKGGQRIVQGVQFNRFGRREGYWLYPDHPGDAFPSLESRFVPASEVIHLYRVDRPGQVRGVTWLAAAMLTLRDFDEFQDAEIWRKKIASCFTAFVHDIDAGVDLAAAKEQAAEDLEPGMIEYLSPGKTVTMGTPPSVEGYKEFADVTLRSIAASLGVTYESLTSDLRGVSFTSGRMGRLNVHADVEQTRGTMVIPRFCRRVWRWFLEAGFAAGNRRLLEIGPGVRADWTPSRREVLDPGKEVAAIKQRVRSGFCSLTEAMREQGHTNPKKSLQRLAADKGLVEELGLTLDSVDSGVQSDRGNGVPAGGKRSRRPSPA